MYKSNLFELLKIFTPKEFKELGDYVKSSFFNKNENVISLYNYIKKYFPDLDSPNLEKQIVYSNLAGNEKYNDGFMRTVIFNLNKLAEDYLAHNSKPEIDKQIATTDVLIKRNAFKLFEKKFKQISDELEKTEIRTKDYYFRKYQLGGMNTAHSSNTRAFLNVKDFIDSEEMQTLENLMIYYFLSSVPEYRYFYNQQYVVKQDFEFPFLDEIIFYLKKERKI